MMKFSTLLPSILPRSLSPLLVLGALTLLTSKGVAATITDFTGIYDPSNWTTITTGVASGIVTPNDTTSLDIELDSGNMNDYIERVIGIDASRAGNLQFSWNFGSLEIAALQTAGYVLNGNYTPVVTSTGDTDTNGDPILVSSGTPVQVSVVAGDTFGFRFLAAEDTSATGIFKINGFSATVDSVVPNPVGVPETDTLPIIGGVFLFALGSWTKRQI